MSTSSSTPTPRQPERWRALLDTMATVTMLVAALYMISSTSTQRGSPTRPSRDIPVPKDPLPLAGSALRGASQAPVIIVEYSDFQCPYCRRFVTDTLPELDRLYVSTGKVRLAFRELPLPIHGQAQRAAEGAECAAQQGQFWQLHDALFAHPTELDEAGIRRHALALGLEPKGFDACMAGASSEKVRTDVASARALGVAGTPAFFIGRSGPDDSVRVTATVAGARPLEEFKRILDRLLMG
jgi:protein-disulfide isomerase